MTRFFLEDFSPPMLKLRERLVRKNNRGRDMRSKLLGSVAVLALMGAVDGAVAQTPIDRITSSWTGGYIGGNVGYSWGRSSDYAQFVSPAGPTLATSAAKFDMNGVIGGGQAGYNVQF